MASLASGPIPSKHSTALRRTRRSVSSSDFISAGTACLAFGPNFSNASAALRRTSTSLSRSFSVNPLTSLPSCRGSCSCPHKASTRSTLKAKVGSRLSMINLPVFRIGGPLLGRTRRGKGSSPTLRGPLSSFPRFAWERGHGPRRSFVDVPSAAKRSAL
jgi:hypothetical protein